MANGNRDRKDGEAANQQHARFVEAAREAGADVDTSAADALMGKLAKTPSEPKLKKSDEVKTNKDRET